MKIFLLHWGKISAILRVIEVLFLRDDTLMACTGSFISASFFCLKLQTLQIFRQNQRLIVIINFVPQLFANPAIGNAIKQFSRRFKPPWLAELEPSESLLAQSHIPHNI